ncbi:CPBP family intramembrane glutamic endopeptidase [Ligilactobacillus acidipiscis]
MVIVAILVGNVPKNILQVVYSHYFLISTIGALASAILEESVTRGLFLSGFINLGMYEGSSYKLTKAAVYSSFLFGILHIFNLVGGNPQAVFQQILYTFSLGTFLVILRITTNGLGLPILLHFLFDLVPLKNSTNVESNNRGVMLLIFTPILILSIFYLIGVDRQLSNNKVD